MIQRIFILMFVLIGFAQLSSAQTIAPLKAVWTADQRFHMDKMPQPGQLVQLEIPADKIQPGFKWNDAVLESSGELVEFTYQGDGKTLMLNIHPEGRKDYKLEDWNLFLTKIVGGNYIK